MNNLNIKTIGELKKFLEENFDNNDKVIGVLDINEDCIYEDGRYRILLPLNANIHVCATLGHLIDEYLGGGRKIFLITGKEIGKGKDNEPLLKNINILKEIEL